MASIHADGRSDSMPRMSRSSRRARAYEEGDEFRFPRTARGLHQAALASGAFVYNAPSLLFMLYVLIPAWTEVVLWKAVVITVLCLVYGVLFAYTPGVRAYPVGDRLAWLGVSWAVMLQLGILIQAEVLYMVMFVQVMHGILVPLKWARVVAPVIAVGVVAASALTEQPISLILALTGLILSLGLAEGIERSILQERLDAAEKRSAVLAVAAERERIGRDLHDILGHSLTTITVSAQLAQRLLDADPDAARAQLAEIERVSRQSLSDVRTTASGMQQVRAATEIASARSVLTAAGIEPEVPVALPVLADDRAELFGYVIREGVTNVVRHARASRCTIRLEEEVVEVADDGVGIPVGRGRSGLAGLERRIGEAGGTLDVDSDTTGTRLTARLPRTIEGVPA